MKKEGDGEHGEEWLVFLEHAGNIIETVYKKKGSWWTRTFVSRILEDLDETYRDV